MKKMIILLMTITLTVSAIVLPALAESSEETAVDQVTSPTVQTGTAGSAGRRQMPGNRMAPQLPDQKGQIPGQNSQNGQQADPDDTQNGQNGQQPMPGRGNRNMKHGGRNGNGSAPMTGKSWKHLDPDRLLKDGVITQDVYDAIMNYMKEHAPQQPESSSAPADTGEAPADNGETSAMPEGRVPADGSTPPDLPDGTVPADVGESSPVPEGESGTAEQQLLRELLANGAITQEQYDLIMAKLTGTDAAAEISGSI